MQRPGDDEADAGLPPLDPSDPLGLLQDAQDPEEAEALQVFLCLGYFYVYGLATSGAAALLVSPA